MLYTIVSGIGLFFTLFWVSEIVYVFRGIKDTRTSRHACDCKEGITVIKPIKDGDFQLRENLESWLTQDYKGPLQYILSFQDKNDGALDIAKQLKERFPQMDIEIIINPIIPGLNGKSSNMKHGVERAKYPVLVFGDSDTRVLPDFLCKIAKALADDKVGVVSCAQMNRGGWDFWTRFFTFIQNNETVFHWSFLTKMGMRVGANGAALGIRKKVLDEIGGIESFGSSLLEDMLLGNLLVDKGYRVKVGPFIECHVNAIDKFKVLNYIQRSSIGFRTLIKKNVPVFIIMLSWYWIVFAMALCKLDYSLLQLYLLFLGIRTGTGLIQRWIIEKRILPVDFILPAFFDVFCTTYLFFSFKNSHVEWRGIRYKIHKNGNIEIVG
ncbi:MAG: glycosyltransferase [Mahellales bacterium]|jgi:ceramide glucosyltransferase